MKPFQYIAMVVLLYSMATACKKEGLINYKGDDTVYFAYADSSKIDSTILSFGYALPEVKDSVLRLRIRVMGYPADKDREYVLTVLPTSTAKAGVDYDALPSSFKIKAGAMSDTVLVRLHRTPAMSNGSVILDLQLNETALFSNNYKANHLRVFVNDILIRPKYWLDVYGGIFSKKKMYLMAEVLGVSVVEINDNTVIAQLIYWGRFMQLYLNDMQAAGNPVYEDDGTLMVMGSGVQ